MTQKGPSFLDYKIKEVSGGITGPYMGLVNARDCLGDVAVIKFLDTVKEKGEALWVRFRTWRDEGEGRGFSDFIKMVNAE